MEISRSVSDEFLLMTIQTFRSAKKLGDKAMAQLEDEHFYVTLDPEANSIEVIIKHLHGNMRSRWTDFLTSDGEKQDRERDDEFIGSGYNREELLGMWENGWECLFQTLESLTSQDLLQNVTIRGEAHSVIQAIQRQVSHYAYHVGQIVFLAKHLKSADWKTLSIARGQSKQFKP